MSNYKSETENFTWDRTLVLGKGNVGCVFYGQSKLTSEAVAVKTFTVSGHDRSINMKLREIELLGKLNHENIVKILAVEDELFPTTGRPNGKKALIMELCTGGSLASALQKPENHYGLPESDFLFVWEHLTNAMRHLRDLNISHRDLKPGNILIYIRENGRKIYKLADFDTARELDDGESFPSLVGTIPYLNPLMYQRAVQLLPGKDCSTSVDLWSIGVTLYETATGKLPFRPHNWHDKNTMYEILRMKPSGTISGVQQGSNGTIQYESTFPSACLLSEGLKALLTPIIAALCDAKEETHWNYQKYFDESYAVLKQKRLHIFFVNTVQSLCIYLNRGGSSGEGTKEPVYNDLTEAIRVQSQILPENQLLFYKSSPLLSFLDTEANLRPIQTTEQMPLILFNKQLETISCNWSPELKQFRQFGNVPDIYADAQTALINMRNAYVRKWDLERMSHKIELIQSVVSTVNQYVVGQLLQISKEANSTMDLATSLENQLGILKAFYESCQSLLVILQLVQSQSEASRLIQKFEADVKEMASEYQRSQVEFTKLKDQLNSLAPPLSKLTHTRVRNQSLVLLWNDLTHSVTDIDNINGFLKSESKLMSQIELSYNILKVDLKSAGEVEPESISHAREYYRHMERLKMPARYQSFENLVKTFRLLFETVLQKFNEWYGTAYFVSMQPEILMVNMTETRASLVVLSARLKNMFPNFRSKLEAFTIELKELLESEELVAAATDDVIVKKEEKPLLLLSRQKDFMETFHQLCNSPQEIQKDLAKCSDVLDASLVILETTISQLQI